MQENKPSFINSIAECLSKIQKEEWDNCFSIYELMKGSLDEYKNALPKEDYENDIYLKEWDVFRSVLIDCIILKAEKSDDFEDFMNWIKKISQIVSDPRSLWCILHTEVHPKIRITPDQGIILSQTLFTPQLLFDFGIVSFLSSDFFQLSTIITEEDIIERFLYIIGFVKSCNLPEDHQIRSQKYDEYILKLILQYINNFSDKVECLLWIIDSIYDYLHLNSISLIGIIKKVIETFHNKCTGTHMSKFMKLCYLSTSKHLNSNTVLQGFTDSVLADAIQEQHQFVRKYIFNSFVSCIWSGSHSNLISDPLAAWRLLLSSKVHMKTIHQYTPDIVLIDFIEDSLLYFTGYYGEIQPSPDRSKDLRRDVFFIVDTSIEFYPSDLPQEVLQSIWYLLTIAAVSGASADQLENICPEENQMMNDPYLGLAKTDVDFVDYRVALNRLSTKFVGELDALPAMISFVRAHYN